jgi:plasmid stabilization system protein ParE
MKFHVLVSAAAENDILQALAWYSEKSQTAAARWKQQLAEALESLQAVSKPLLVQRRRG